MGVEHDLAALAAAHAAGRTFALRGGGVSMWPSLRPGDVTHFAAPTGPARPGEIWLVRRGMALVAHRIVSRSPAGVVLRGDAMPTADPPVPEAALLGCLVLVERGGRTIAWPPPWDSRYAAGLRILHGRWPAATRALRILGRLTAPHSRG